MTKAEFRQEIEQLALPQKVHDALDVLLDYAENTKVLTVRVDHFLPIIINEDEGTELSVCLRLY